MRRIRTIDAEVAGEAVRLIVGGAPSVVGRTMADKLKWLEKNADELRRILMLEPRGHSGMHGAMLTEPATPSADAGMLSMHAAGYPWISGDGAIGAITLALENKLIEGAGDELLVDTPAGQIAAGPSVEAGRVSRVSLTLPASFVFKPGVALEIGRRHISVDVAFGGGEFYAIADSEAVGIPAELSNEKRLIQMASELTDAIESSIHVAHPADARFKTIDGVIFTAGARAGADLRSATVLRGGVLRRSPGAGSTAALIAVLDAMGILPAGQVFVHEGILGTTLKGSALRPVAAELGEVVPLIEGSATTTGFHEFMSTG